MSEACTIYSPAIEYLGVLDYVRSVMDSEFEIIGDDREWKSLLIRGKQSMLKLNSMQSGQPGDKFSTILFGTERYFGEIETQSEQNKKYVVERIPQTIWLIGVVADPEFVESDKHFEIIFGITSMVDGMIFNGNAMLDANGEILLDSSGDSEVVI